VFHEVNDFSGSVIHRVPVLFFHLDLPTVGSGKEEDVNDFIQGEQLVVAKGRQTMEFVEDQVGQVIVKHADLHVSWLATLAMQVPLGMVENVVRHECGDHVVEGVANDGKCVVMGIVA
jgi:hypothetical protein